MSERDCKKKAKHKNYIIHVCINNMIQAINIKANTNLMPGISSIIHEYMIQKWSFYYQP